MPCRVAGHYKESFSHEKPKMYETIFDIPASAMVSIPLLKRIAETSH